MPDYIGNIAVPEIPVSGVFPIKPDMGWGQAWEPDIAIHQFGSGDAKTEQRFLLGTGAKKFTVRKAFLRESDRIALRDFWESHYGPYGAFYYDAPNDSGAGTTRYVCRFAAEPLSWQMVTDWVCSTGVTLIEVPQSSPVYAVNDTLARFPSSDLQDALLAQAQEIIPLIAITPRAPVLTTEPTETPQPAIQIPGNCRPWEVGDLYPGNVRFSGAPDDHGQAPHVAFTGLSAGQKIVIPAVTGTVAYDNLGNNTYVWAPPAGDMNETYGGGDMYERVDGFR